MTSFLHNLHIELRHGRSSRRGASVDDQQDASEGLHKEYPRMHRVVLPPPSHLTKSLSEVLDRRHSFISCTEGPLTIQEWSTLLGTALRKHPNSTKRHYPSGGSLYPIETYLIAPKITDAKESGVFHYHPTAHALEHLTELPTSFDMEKLMPNHGGLSTASVILFTSVWDRSAVKYGDFAYVLALLEAGHMSENVLLTATAMDLGARPLGGFNDVLAVHLLDID